MNKPQEAKRARDDATRLLDKESSLKSMADEQPQMPTLPEALEARSQAIIAEELTYLKANATAAQKAKDEEILEQMQSDPEMMQNMMAVTVADF